MWGTSYAGGHVIVTAATDARVEAGVAQVPAIGGMNTPEIAFMLTDALLQDAIKPRWTKTRDVRLAMRVLWTAISTPQGATVEIRHTTDNNPKRAGL